MEKLNFDISYLDPWSIPTPDPNHIREFYQCMDLEYFPDICYKITEQRDLCLDVLKKKNLPAGRPVVFCIHGGAWRKGTNKNLNASAFALNDCVTFNLQYRFTTEAPYPAGLEDCLDAYAWVKRNAAVYGGDPHNISIRGGSSGAHYALMMALKLHDPDLKAVVAACAPSNLDTCYQNTLDQKMTFSEAFELLCGNQMGEEVTDRKLLIEKSPYFLFQELSEKERKELPPFLLMHGDADPIVPFNQTVELHKMMDAIGISNEFYPFAGAKHNYEYDGETYCHERMKIILDFLNRHQYIC